jgi:hypothetical protein
MSLETPNPLAAAARARTLYRQIKVNGWPETLNERAQTPGSGGVNYERRHKRLLLLKEELAQRFNGDRLSKRFWEIVRGIGCANCGFNKWPTILQFHHIDRDRKNDSLENLTVLCPNCHSALHHVKAARVEIKSLAQLMKEHFVTWPQAPGVFQGADITSLRGATESLTYEVQDLPQTF